MLGSLTSGSTITGATITGGVINGTIINSEDGLVVENSGSIRLNNSSGYVRMTGLYVSGSGNVLSVSANGGISVGSGSNAWVSATGGFILDQVISQLEVVILEPQAVSSFHLVQFIQVILVD